jgi:hypothetical protein
MNAMRPRARLVSPTRISPRGGATTVRVLRGVSVRAMAASQRCFVGVDFGTSGARATVIDGAPNPSGASRRHAQAAGASHSASLTPRVLSRGLVSWKATQPSSKIGS